MSAAALPPVPAPAIAPYYPPPTSPPPRESRGQTESRAVVAFVSGVMGILLGLPLGLPGLILGPVAYFVGKAAVERIDTSEGALGGRGSAVSGWVMGVVATAIGAAATLVWLVVLLVAISGPSTG